MEIMNKYFSHSRSFLLASTALFSSLVLASAADVVLQKVPALIVDQVPTYPQNLARYYLGANIEVAPQGQPIANLQLSSETQDRNTAEAALLCDDPTVGYALPAGNSTVLVSLQKVEHLGRVVFSNDGANGTVSIATSNAKLPSDSPQWHAIGQQPLAPQTVAAELAGSEAKYVRLTFDVTQPGRIASLGVFSTPQISDFTLPRVHKMAVQDQSDSFALISYKLTDIHAKGRALYVSSGTDARRANDMIDDQTETSYTFATEDGSPTTVIDLGKSSSLRRVSSVYSPRAGTMTFYVLPSLPAVTAGDVLPDNFNLNDATFASLQPVGAVKDDGTRGRASIDFPATTGRYLMVRWTPAAQHDSSFSIAEVAAFGKAGERTNLLAANTAGAPNESRGQISDGKTMLDGKTMIEAKDMPAEGPAEALPQSPAEGPPPPLPQPPPFTFVPVLVPPSR